MKKLLLCILTAICLCSTMAFAACGASHDTSEDAYTLTVEVNEQGYGTVSTDKVEKIAKDTAITVDGNKLNVGSTEITATPTSATAQYTYAFTGWTVDAETITENLTVTANFTRTTNSYAVHFEMGAGEAIDDIIVEYGTSVSELDEIEVIAPEHYRFDKWQLKVGESEYVDFDGTETLEGEITVKACYELDLLVVLSNAQDFEDKFKTEFFEITENEVTKYYYYSFELADDIDMTDVTMNNTFWENDIYPNAYTGTIDGKGHVISNLTFNPDQYASYGGLINYKAGYGAVLKDIALVNMSTPRAFITNKAEGLTIKNVYISGTSGWGKVFDEAHVYTDSEVTGDQGKVVIENVIINANAELFDSTWSANVIINNVINLSKYVGGVPRFFADYADGLGEEWADSGFAITEEGLTFHGTLILEKALPAPAISLTSESDLNAKFLKNDNDSYELTSDIICETGTSITYKIWTKFGYGTLDGKGHIVKDAVIDDDISSYGILGKDSVSGIVKDIAFVNATNSYRGYLIEDAEDLTVENAYFSGTFGINSGWNDLIQNAKGNVVFKNVIIDCYGVNNGGYAAGKAGTGAENVTYENVITLDKNGKGAREGSDYGGTLMTYEEFFTTFADGLGEEWADSGFAITAEGLTFHGTLILEKPAA